VALAGHVAAGRDERARAEPVLLGAEERGDHDVPPELQATIGAQHHAVAKPLPDEDLVRLREPQLPRRAGRLDRRERAGARPAAVPGDQDVVRVRLRDAGGDRPDARRGDKLHADPGHRVDRPQVRDQLREVLDRVDVVVGRRADVRHADLAATKRGDERRRLPSGQLAALARLRALGHLDLELLGAGKVARRHAEPRGGVQLRTGAEPREARVRQRRRRAGCLQVGRRVAGQELAAEARERRHARRPRGGGEANGPPPRPPGQARRRAARPGSSQAC